MRQSLVSLMLVIAIFPNPAFSQAGAPTPIFPENAQWVSPPNLPGVQAAWLLGEEEEAGLYLLRVKLAARTKIPPHTHPDERSSTVMSGTLYVGFGETFDEANMVAVPAGAIYIAPANMPHYIWAKDGEALYQESGIGPSGTTILER
ncbi:cupin [Litchfieldella qijiaojingensis]|uniref:Cupin n=1 Tax=Litchfieldella qijiaojingensis TaxID=980347 RepID=A0ABQ2Z284_9GAMM|nr:cupin domain-containing protein [Halomonas qijiaojingensis]GGY01080.1 cupin [Halomonas qijiaojingensis]